MKTLQILFLLFFFSLKSFSQSNYQAPTLSAGLDNITFKKGSLDVELLTKIIIEKQKELVREGLKKIIYEKLSNNTHLSSYSQFYIENIIGILFEEKNHKIITKRVLEETTNFLFVIGISKLVYKKFENDITHKLFTPLKNNNSTSNVKNDSNRCDRIELNNNFDSDVIIYVILDILQEIPLVKQLGLLNNLNYDVLQRNLCIKNSTEVILTYKEEIKKFIELILQNSDTLNDITSVTGIVLESDKMVQKALNFYKKKITSYTSENLLELKESNEQILLNKILKNTNNFITTANKYTSKSINEEIRTLNSISYKTQYSIKEIKSFYASRTKILNFLNDIDVFIDFHKNSSTYNNALKILYKAPRDPNKAITSVANIFSNSSLLSNNHFNIKIERDSLVTEVRSFFYETSISNINDLKKLKESATTIRNRLSNNKTFFDQLVALNTTQDSLVDISKTQEKITVLNFLKLKKENVFSSFKTENTNSLVNEEKFHLYKKELEKIDVESILLNTNSTYIYEKIPLIESSLLFEEISSKIPFKIKDIIRNVIMKQYENNGVNNIFSLVKNSILQELKNDGIKNLTPEENNNLKDFIKTIGKLETTNEKNIINNFNQDLTTDLLFILKKIGIDNNKINKIIATAEFGLTKFLVKNKFSELEKVLPKINFNDFNNFLKFIAHIKEFDKAQTFDFLLKTMSKYEKVLFLNCDTACKKNQQIFLDIVKSLKTYSITDLKNDLIEIDVASVLNYILEKYQQNNKWNFYTTVGLNQFIAPKDGTQFNAASEKIGIKYRLNKSKPTYYKNLLNDIKDKKLISEYYAMLYGSGILYKIAKTTDERFNDVSVGIALGASFFNFLDLNISYAVPTTGFDNAYFGISFDIPLSEYLKRL